jgi:hypothetical protein
MPKRKLLLLVLACLALVLLAGAGFLAIREFSPRQQIDRQGIGAIRKGMTEAEVVRVFAVPPGDYSTKRVGYNSGTYFSSFGSEKAEPAYLKTWTTDRMRIQVGFDSDGKVCWVSQSLAGIEDGPWDRLLRLLRDRR